MAVETPAHRERFGLHDTRHGTDVPVAAFTADTVGYVNGVIEIYVVGEIVDATPIERRPREIAIAHAIEEWAMSPDLRVTAHALAARRNAGVR